MLFKTLNPNSDNLSNFTYTQLPKKFHFEKLEKQERHLLKGISLLDRRVVLKRNDHEFDYEKEKDCAFEISEALTLREGTKHLYFYKENGYYEHHFFCEDGYIIDEKGKTIERL